MEELLFKGLSSFGLIGIVLYYLLRKDSEEFQMHKKTFETYQDTMVAQQQMAQETVKTLQEMQKQQYDMMVKQQEMGCDIADIKKELGI